GDSALRWQTIGRLGVVAGRAYELTIPAGTEAVCALLHGEARIESEHLASEIARNGRDFTEGPTYLTLPPETSCRIVSQSPTTDLLMVQAPVEAMGQNDEAGTFQVTRPTDAPARRVGAGNWAREVWPGVSLVPGLRRLLVGETRNPPGNWSSYPPHKHDTAAPPIEAIYEEAYFLQFSPAGGFGLQRIYTRPAPNGETPEIGEAGGASDQVAPTEALDEVFAVEEGDLVIIPRGYHPVVAAPGYQMRYVWALCGAPGAGRRYGAWSDDPAHAWLRAVEPILSDR
ncbi:MAG TPA: 5-deoxy-glucuronate isomerase, partial [Ktedonobacterales bacterium]|nr:5-deoxy-glucuronate isomerase [Ktedonobacterales bacterium]